MKLITNILSKSALAVCVLWIAYALVASITLTGGRFWLSGGGSIMLSFIPAALFAITIYKLEKTKSKFRLHLGLLFWLSMALTASFFITFVSKMDHWPYGVAFAYLNLTIVSIIQAIFFLRSTKEST